MTPRAHEQRDGPGACAFLLWPLPRKNWPKPVQTSPMVKRMAPTLASMAPNRKKLKHAMPDVNRIIVAALAPATLGAAVFFF